mmetsp:Transcript_24166/g.53774  ORF Transcript_24166/g.53774 Transcript_24166/m.53774 type:complete len:214 (-) Transcript_24166:280-921(-)
MRIRSGSPLVSSDSAGSKLSVASCVTEDAGTTTSLPIQSSKPPDTIFKVFSRSLRSISLRASCLFTLARMGLMIRFSSARTTRRNSRTPLSTVLGSGSSLPCRVCLHRGINVMSWPCTLITLRARSFTSSLDLLFFFFFGCSVFKSSVAPSRLTAISATSAFSLVAASRAPWASSAVSFSPTCSLLPLPAPIFELSPSASLSLSSALPAPSEA